MWLCSFGLVGFIWARAVGRRVHSGSLPSFWRPVAVVALIWARSVYFGAPLGSSYSFRSSNYIGWNKLWDHMVPW